MLTDEEVCKGYSSAIEVEKSADGGRNGEYTIDMVKRDWNSMKRRNRLGRRIRLHSSLVVVSWVCGVFRGLVGADGFVRGSGGGGSRRLGVRESCGWCR